MFIVACCLGCDICVCDIDVVCFAVQLLRCGCFDVDLGLFVRYCGVVVANGVNCLLLFVTLLMFLVVLCLVCFFVVLDGCGCFLIRVGLCIFNSVAYICYLDMICFVYSDLFICQWFGVFVYVVVLCCVVFDSLFSVCLGFMAVWFGMFAAFDDSCLFAYGFDVCIGGELDCLLALAVSCCGFWCCVLCCCVCYLFGVFVVILYLFVWVLVVVVRCSLRCLLAMFL